MGSRIAVATTSAPKVGPFMSQAVISNGLVFSAGSLGIDPKTGKFVEGTVADRAVSTHRRAGSYDTRLSTNRMNRPTGTSPPKSRRCLCCRGDEFIKSGKSQYLSVEHGLATPGE